MTVLTGPMNVAERIVSVFDTAESTGYSSRFERLYRKQGISRITLDHQDLDLLAHFRRVETIGLPSVGHSPTLCPSQNRGMTSICFTRKFFVGGSIACS